MGRKKKHEFEFSSVAFDSPLNLEFLNARSTVTRGKMQSPRPPDWSRQHSLVQLLGTSEYEKFRKKSWGRNVCEFHCKDRELLAKYFNLKKLRKDFFKNYEGVVRKANMKNAGLNALTKDFYDWTDLRTSVDLYGQPAKASKGHWHWDSVDKFLFHLEGEGQIEIFAPIGAQILWQQNNKNLPHLREENFKLIKTIKKQPGHIIYIPRGTPHRHIDRAEQSMHAAVWLQPISIHDIWSRLCHFALAQCESQPIFRKTIGSMDVNKAATDKNLAAISKTFIQQLDSRLIEYYWRSLRIQQQPLAHDAARALRKSRSIIDKDISAARFQRTSIQFDFNNQFGKWELILPNSKIYFDHRNKRIIEKILSLDSFKIDDIKKFNLALSSTRKLIDLLIEHDLFRVTGS